MGFSSAAANRLSPPDMRTWVSADHLVYSVLDTTPLPGGLTIPAEVTRRQERRDRLLQAKAEMEARACARFQAAASSQHFAAALFVSSGNSALHASPTGC